MDSVPKVKTRFLILSDTHGLDLREHIANLQADVVLHCGDLTTESKLDEFQSSIHLLEQINSPLKLCIPGNHDLTLDPPTFQQKLTDAELTSADDRALAKEVYGEPDEARAVFQATTTDTSIILLTEGTHQFTLANGATLTVYASPYTPSALGNWAFQYRPQDGHLFDIPDGVDLVMTHGPPRGILDVTHSGERAGCPGLFGAVARARPLVHCFGHIHEGWGARVVAWRKRVSQRPSHLTDINNGRSVVVKKLRDVNMGAAAGGEKVCRTSHCAGDRVPIRRGEQTLFVNAAVEGNGACLVQPVWLVEVELPGSVPE